MTAIEFRTQNPVTSTTDTDLYDVDPLRDAFKRFASGATLYYIDTDGTKLSEYSYGTPVQIQYSTDSGSTWSSRFEGIALTPTQTTRDGLPAVEVEVVGYSHLLTRANIVAEYSSTARSAILQDLVETYSSVNWVANNVDVTDDDTVDMTFRGQTPDQAIEQIASDSADEEWGVDSDLEFFFESQSISSGASITDSDVIEYNLPKDGKRNINEYRLYYGSSGNDVVVVNDRTQQRALKDDLNAPRGVVISQSDHVPEITTQARAEAVARARLNDQSVIQTGTVTVPLGRFNTEAGDVISVTISDAGISSTEFRVAQVDYNWGRGETDLTIAENTGGNIDELLIALSDQLVNARLREADPNASEVQFLDLETGITITTSGRLTKKRTTGDSFIPGVSQLGLGSADTLGGEIAEVESIPIESHKVNTNFLNLVRDLWADGNSAHYAPTELDVGRFAFEDASVTTTSMGFSEGRTDIQKYGAGDQADRIEVLATVPGGGPFADAPPNDLDEFGLFSGAGPTGDDMLAYLTTGEFETNTRRRVKVVLTYTIDTDAETQGVITTTGQERTVDLLLGESGHEPTDVVYGTGTADASESDTALGSKQHEDTIDATTDKETGVVLFTEETTSGEANTQNWSEIGEENSANELLSRVAYRPLASDTVLIANHRWTARNA